MTDAANAPGSAIEPFWRTKTLDEMTPQEWESLCDGCGRCCLIKLIDDVTDDLHFTDVACRLFDEQTCKCRDYSNRGKRVPDCVILTPELVDRLTWMPSTCAYRMIYEGKDLAWWHPLVCGDPKMVHEAVISVRGRTISEDDVTEDKLPDRIVDWIE